MQHLIQFNFQARYFQSGALNENTRRLIFVLHGYGQLAGYFIKKFDVLKNDATCIIAPEGLSRYYLENSAGRVGATWMTKEERLTDIQNYITYLSAIYHKAVVQTENVEISIAGFSQGAATASRWAASDNIDFDKLVLLSGYFPPDMDFGSVSEKLKSKDVYYVYGKDDPYLTKERVKEMKNISGQLGVDATQIAFDGVHEINPASLLKIWH